MTVGFLKMPMGRITDSLEDMAELLVDTFASVFVGEVPVNPASNQTHDGTMPEIVITVARVHEALLCLNVNSVMGPDHVHPHVLRVVLLSLWSLYLLFSIGHLPKGFFQVCGFNLLSYHCSMQHLGMYDPVNYHPDSLTSICCKTVERIVASELVSYLDSSGLMSDSQFGFRKCRSTENQVLLVYTEIAELVDEGLVVDMIMIDFFKAFDVVCHIVLLNKLKAIGVGVTLLNCIWGFLTNCSM